jgi:enoyl-CoA hydratase
MHYADFQFLTFDKKPNGVLVMTLNRPEVMNATNARLHWELTQIWSVLDADDSVRVVVVTGAGERAFSAGGDLDWLAEMVGNAAKIQGTMREASDIVTNMLAFEKPVISAINGVAVGAGLAVALMADYLMTADFIDGKEAERIGLVSLCTPRAQLTEKALATAAKLAKGSQPAIRYTKRSLNNWMRISQPAFDASLALEMLCFLGDDAKEGVAALKEKREAKFPSALD